MLHSAEFRYSKLIFVLLKFYLVGLHIFFYRPKDVSEEKKYFSQILSKFNYETWSVNLIQASIQLGW